MKELKLLQLVPSLESGGVEQAVVDVSNYIASKGIKSFIVSEGGIMTTYLDRNNVIHFNLPLKSKNLFTIYKNSKKIKKIIQENNINLVHVRSRAPAWSLRFISNKKFIKISTFHNVYGHSNILKKYYNFQMAKVKKIVAISEYVKSSIIKNYDIKKNKITVINRGIDTKYFDQNINLDENYINFLEKFNIPNDKKIILFPGRLTSWKGQIEFLEILKKLDLTKIVCYFVGNDTNKSFKNRLINKAKILNLEKSCKIVGTLSKEEMRFIYKTSDIVISAPIRPEGFGRIVSESLSMEKMLVAYNFGGVKDQLSSLDKIYAIEPKNQIEMIDRINKIFELSEKRKNQLGKIARDHVIKNFSKENMLKNYYKFYKNIFK